MNTSFKGLKVILAPLAIAAVAGFAASGCSEAADAAGVGCEASISARVDALQGSVDAMTTLAGEFKADVAGACAAIAMAGGEMVTVSANPTDDEVNAACTAAQAAMSASLSAAGTITLEYQPVECRVNAEAQVSCEGGCKVDASCMEPELSVRCMGGELSVECSGECMGTATCEGSAMVAANCEGTCAATCEGTCSGTCTGECSGTCSSMNADGSCNGMCEGDCNGNCEGTCTGTCTGKCELMAGAMVTCNAEARCEGECMGTATAPECSGELTPPMCEADADCQASCEGEASFEAECTPPSVQFVFSGMVDAAFVTALEANLPVFLAVMAKGETAVTIAGDIAGDILAIGESSATCAASLAGEIAAAGRASASINVSVMASASATGSAMGGA